MKYCEKCGKQLSDDALFCSNCGTKIVKTEFSIDGMDGHKFEYFCAEVLKKNGFFDVSVTPGSGDQGVDVLATKEGIKYAIQCKNYSTTLGNTPVQEVNAGKVYYGCHVGVVMTNSSFSQGAKDLAAATNVLLWDGNKIKEMMRMLTDEDLKSLGAFETLYDNFSQCEYTDSECMNDTDYPTVRKGMARLAVGCYVWTAICVVMGIVGIGDADDIGKMMFGEGLVFLVLGFMFSQLKWSPKGNKHVWIGKIVINKTFFVWSCIILAFAVFGMLS